MLEAIAQAELGNDSFQEDPTVNRLEALAAEKMGKESALLTVSGTMANLISLMALTNGGDEVIVEAMAHMYYNEGRGVASLARVYTRPIKGHLGVLDPQDVEKAIRPISRRPHDQPRTTLVCIENTHNNYGGTVVRPDQIEAIHEVAQAHDLRLYMDGARIFNAAVALKVDVRELTRHVDVMMFCLSKGLSAPVGSLIVGDEEFVEKARWVRQEVGGAMRQAGIIAAPGIVALETMVDRLADDHKNARTLAEGLACVNGISIDLETVQTNIVYFDVSGLGVDSGQFVSALGKRGIKCKTRGRTVVRMVTYRGIEEDDVRYVQSVIEDVARELREHRSG
jgi:threonine aldolase